MRIWASLDGKFTVDARLKSFDGAEVLLEKKDGRTIRVPVEKLSNKDRKFVDRWQNAAADSEDAEIVGK